MACSSNSTTSTCSQDSISELGNLMGCFLSDTSQDVICGLCSDGAPVTSLCNDCNEYMCDRCAEAHLRIGFIKGHRVRRISALPMDDASSCSTSETLTNSLPAISSSEVHKDYRLFDDTCYSTTYSSLAGHTRHDLSYMQSSETLEHQKMANAIKNARRRIDKTVHNTYAISRKVETKHDQVVSDIESVFKSYIIAMVARRDALIRKVNDIYSHKQKQIMAQIGRLQDTQNQLNYASNILNSAPSSFNDNHRQRVKHLCYSRQDSDLPSDEFATFNVMDNGIYGAINRLGCLSFGPPPRGHQEASTSQAGQEKTEKIPPCRPIYGVDVEVVVRRSHCFPMIVGAKGTQKRLNGELLRPYGACCNKLGQIIVADRSNNRIQIFDSNGMYVHQFGSEGSAKGQFNRPAGICVDPFDRIVVVDKDNHRVQIFTMDGSFVLAFGELGDKLGQFNYPWDVACNSQGEIAVSDTRNRRIQIFDCRGELVAKFHYDASVLDNPRGVAYTPGGDLVVTDFNNHRVSLINRKTGDHRYFGMEGSAQGQFFRPQGVVCDDRGNIIVADSRNNRIQAFDGMGRFLFAFGRKGEKPGEFNRPSGMCLTPSGRIVVVDFENHRVQVY